MADIPRFTLVELTDLALDNKPKVRPWTPAAYEQPGLSTGHKVHGVTCTDSDLDQPVAVMRRGLLRGVTEQNGETWAVGDILWGTSGGSISKVRPTAPTPLVVVGTIFQDEGTGGPFTVAVDVRVLPSLGELSGVLAETPVDKDVFIFKGPDHVWEPRQLDHGADFLGLADNDHPQYKVRHGFARSSAGAHLVTISYNPATRIVTVSPTASTFDFWVDGVKFTKTGAQAAPAHANSAGLHFVTYSAAGALAVSTTPWSMLDRTKIPVALVYFNNLSAIGICFFEAHRDERNLDLHHNLHFTQGTKLLSGAAISGYTLDTDTDAAVTYAIASGVLADEDIFHTLTALADGGPYTVLYRTGASGIWTFDSTPTFPFKSGTTYPQWNELTGGAWQLTEMSGLGLGEWVNYYVLAVPSVAAVTQFLLIPGQAVHGSLAAARGETLASLSLGTLPFEEAASLYRITLHSLSTYGGTHQCRIEDVTEIKAGGATIRSATSPEIHNALAERDAADVHPASSVTFTPYDTVAATDVQGAIQELLDEGIDPKFQRGGVFLNPAAGANVVIWRAPFACTVLNVRGYRSGGTGATVNARKNGTSTHLASDLSLTSDQTWMDGGSVQNASYAAGDSLELMLQSASGTPSQVTIQVDFERAGM